MAEFPINHNMRALIEIVNLEFGVSVTGNKTIGDTPKRNFNIEAIRRKKSHQPLVNDLSDFERFSDLTFEILH